MPDEHARPLARASQRAIVLDLATRPHAGWPELIAGARRALAPDGVLTLRLPAAAGADLVELRLLLARDFAAIELFAWDGFVRTPPGPNASADLYALCSPHQPLPIRSLDLLRPRLIADGPEWRSTWLCERPALPDCFLLRAALEVIPLSGADEAGDPALEIDVRLRFLTAGRDRYKLEARLAPPPDGVVELLLASDRAIPRGEPAWHEVERIALDVSVPDGPAGARGDGAVNAASFDVRIRDLRLCAPAGALRARAAPRTSAQLRPGYDTDYYRDMSGHGLAPDLREHVNLHRAYALLLAAPARALDIGAARGELARHLLRQGIEVTLLDYSPTAIALARELIGEHSRARFVIDEAANLDAHVAPASQQAIFMTDFVEHLTTAELLPVLQACRRALAPDGQLIIHTPERYSGAIVTAKAIHGLHLNLFEIEGLRELLAEAFESVDVFTWDGLERFQERGHCIELFARAGAGGAASRRRLPVSAGGTVLDGSTVLDPQLPERFLLDATVELDLAAQDGEMEVIFQDATGRTLARAARQLSQLRTLPARLRLGSELLLPDSPDVWAGVQRILVQAQGRDGRHIELAISDVVLSWDAPYAARFAAGVSGRGSSAIAG